MYVGSRDISSLTSESTVESTTLTVSERANERSTHFGRRVGGGEGGAKIRRGREFIPFLRGCGSRDRRSGDRAETVATTRQLDIRQTRVAEPGRV